MSASLFLVPLFLERSLLFVSSNSYVLISLIQNSCVSPQSGLCQWTMTIAIQNIFCQYLFCIFKIYLFIYIPNATPISVLSHGPPPNPLPLRSWEDVPLPYLPILVHQVSAGLGTSSPTEARQDSPLLHMSLEPRISQCWLVAQSLGTLKGPG